MIYSYVNIVLLFVNVTFNE